MNDYRKIKFLNSGTYGDVFLVEKIKCKTKYALKCIKIFNIDRYYTLSILNEIKILLTNDSNYLLKCYDIFIDHKNKLCLITEYINGGDLDNYLKNNNNNLSENDIISIFLKICVGINSLHKNYVVHRDIKPANILLSDSGELKICDFGISKYLNFCKITKTFIGTPYFMSPEQLSNNYYDYKIDNWAIGCILYILIYKNYPFKAKDINELKKNITNFNPLLIDKFSNNFSINYFKNILIGLLEKNRYSRLNLEVFLNDDYIKNLLDLYKINTNISIFKNYEFKTVPRNINDWNNLILTLKKDFNLPRNISIKSLKTSNALYNLKNYNEIIDDFIYKSNNHIYNNKLKKYKFNKIHINNNEIKNEKNKFNMNIDYTKINYNKIDYNKIDYNKIDYSKINYSKINYNNIDYSKIDYSNIDYNKIDYSKIDYNKIDYFKINYNNIDYSKIDYNKIDYSNIDIFKIKYMYDQNFYYSKLDNKYYKFNNSKWINNLRKY